jgi:hypothetical protein
MVTMKLEDFIILSVWETIFVREPYLLLVSFTSSKVLVDIETFMCDQ